MKKFITFSVAAYNIEPYINKLMESFLTTWLQIDKIEIFILNRCSKDKISEITRNYVNKYQSLNLCIVNI